LDHQSQLVRSLTPACAILFGLCFAVRGAADEIAPSSEQIEYFESKVRPLLVEHCYECHSLSAKKLKGGLKLDSREAALKGGDSGASLVPGDSAKSLIVDAVRWKSFEMPPKGKLAAEQIEILSRWVDSGAAWPADVEQSVTTAPATYNWSELRSQHWAWQPVQRPRVPDVKNAAWATSEIDRFVLAGLESSGLTPAPAADPVTLIRRVYFDLVGLPPPPEKIDEFVAAASKNRAGALASLVDELLASPQYGERWARHWLDVARYSDGFGGFLDGAAMPEAWRYRDWVIEALNQDLPFDQFIRQQIAGDLLDPPHAVATGFLALGPTYISDGGDPDATAQAQSETLDDRVDTLSRGLLGLTAACARCHDHKFDPIPQLDYYSLAGVFHNTRLNEYPLAPAETVQAYQQHQQRIRDQEAKVRKPAETAKAENRELTDDEKKQVEADTAQLEELKKTAPAKYPVAHTIADSGASDMALAIRGNLRKPGPIAPRRFLRILAGEDAPTFQPGSGRLALADALVSSSNPLTARVFVNRIWLQHVGQGLVRTPSNFGKLGEAPTHPELLDWLAFEFMTTQGWSIKKLHRAIVLSSTYQMSSAMNPAAFAVDGDNRKLWRMNPRRLDVEAWRDAFLSVTGELDRTVGGPPVDALLQSPRRTLYAAVSRNGDRFAADAFLRLFDFPLPRASSEGRKTSVIPQQSLFLMNSSFMAARAKALAARLQNDSGDDNARIERAYRLLYGRSPTDHERQLGAEFLSSEPDPAAEQKLSPWEQYAQVLLSASEFMHIP
jgi:hypothetical protein